MADIRIGIECRQKHSASALCVVEGERRGRYESEALHFCVRHLEALPAGSNFVQQADRYAEVSRNIFEKTLNSPQAYLNLTGLGQPVLDTFRHHVRREGSIRPVYFNHGDRCVEDFPQIILGKAYLVSRLQTLLQAGQLHLPRTAEAEQLAEDLNDYEVTVDEKANERYGSFAVGARDELVMALGLAVHRKGSSSSMMKAW